MLRTPLAPLLALSLLSPPVLAAEDADATAVELTREEQETFLLTAEIVDMQTIDIGVTGSRRATLSDGNRTHDAHIQSVDITLTKFQSGGATEFNFRDFYGFNVAAYRLDKLVGLNMVPVSVKRKVPISTRRKKLQRAAVSWWVDDVRMSGTEFWERGMKSPPTAGLADQRFQAQAFQQLVYNKDPNLGNFLIDKNWKAWLLDFTRSFRKWKTLENPAQLRRIGRGFYERLRDLDPAAVEREVGPYISKAELHGLLARREALIRHFAAAIEERGEVSVLIDKPGF